MKTFFKKTVDIHVDVSSAKITRGMKTNSQANVTATGGHVLKMRLKRRDVASPPKSLILSCFFLKFKTFSCLPFLGAKSRSSQMVMSLMQ